MLNLVYRSYVPYIPKVSNLYGFVKIDNLYYSQVCVASSFTLKAYACPKNISGTNIPLSSFEWYYNGNLLSTTTGVSAAIVDTFTTQVTSEGQHVFWCNITDQQNNKFLAPTVIYAVSCV